MQVTLSSESGADKAFANPIRAMTTAKLKNNTIEKFIFENSFKYKQDLVQNRPETTK